MLKLKINKITIRPHINNIIIWDLKIQLRKIDSLKINNNKKAGQKIKPFFKCPNTKKIF